ncbi:DUF4286 family protein [Azohydromonas australica]|uniref:DUF4286 family protein n=1 Tax=Azohydromonas australica TaxID=364039 RepID=UPI00040EBEE9|nr:DUF4286 family protein [Azohydromonas australica]
MVFGGTGILMSSMQVLAQEEDDFNLWFDTEHLPERVAIPGFLDARRYESLGSPVRYLQIYNAVDFEALDSAPYRAALANQTAWSLHHIARFIEPTRVVGRLVHSRGQARGGAVALVRLRPKEGVQMVPGLESYLQLLDMPGVLGVHFVEGDPELSKPVTVTGPHPGSSDDYIIFECAGADLAQRVVNQVKQPGNSYGELVEAAAYRLRMDLTADALSRKKKDQGLSSSRVG